jgi:uncharacterized SAM-binding protein YcdF (DUF218 family)
MTLVPTRWWASFFMPSCLLLMGLAVGIVWCFWAWKRGRTPRQARLPIALAIGSALPLYLASTPWVARWAAWTLERQHPPVAVESLPQADAIVVLAGSIAAMPRPDGSIHVFARGASDRFETGLAAFRAGCAPVIVFGSSDSGVAGAPTEGSWNRARAIERGVPGSAAIAVERALYTRDEASNVAAELKQLGETGAQTIILCTSATHMPRAARHFRALGLEVVPLPCDFATLGPSEGWSATLLIPRGQALSLVDLAAKEWLGMLAGR